MCWLIGLAAALLILGAKVGIRVKWNSCSPVVWLQIGVLRLKLHLFEKKKSSFCKKSKKDSASSARKKSKTNVSGTKEMKLWVRALVMHWRSLLVLVGRILRMPSVKVFLLRIIVGGAEPDETAIKYGKICGALSAGLNILQKTCDIREQNICVRCEFDRPSVDVSADVAITIRVFEIFLVLGCIIRLLVRLYFTKKNNSKVVQSYETSVAGDAV